MGGFSNCGGTQSINYVKKRYCREKKYDKDTSLYTVERLCVYGNNIVFVFCKKKKKKNPGEAKK